jgi:hypothetical protein
MRARRIASPLDTILLHFVSPTPSLVTSTHPVLNIGHLSKW